MFEPIDHKDSDPEYRQRVRAAMERTYGPLSSIASRSDLVGKWKHSSYGDDTPYVLHEDGTVSGKYDNASNPKGRWNFANDRFEDQTWYEPSPEYGLHDGGWNVEEYHCMITRDGVVVMWNGDGSMQMTLTPIR